MQSPTTRFIEVSEGAGPPRRIAYIHEPVAASQLPGLVWLCGFNSVMTSTKASALADWAAEQGLSMLRFDYSGHGASGGAFADGTIGQWLADAAGVLRQVAHGPQILVGSSMGGWITLLLLRAISTGAPLAKDLPPIKGAVLLAPAWDMTEELIWNQMSDEARTAVATDGVWMRPSAYGDPPYPITAELIEEGRRHLIADAPFDPGCPVHIIQGLQDPDVPWQHANKLTGMLGEGRVTTLFIPDGEHRLSRPQDIEKLFETIANLYATVRS